MCLYILKDYINLINWQKKTGVLFTVFFKKKLNIDKPSQLAMELGLLQLVVQLRKVVVAFLQEPGPATPRRRTGGQATAPAHL